MEFEIGVAAAGASAAEAEATVASAAEAEATWGVNRESDLQHSRGILKVQEKSFFSARKQEMANMRINWRRRGDGR